MLKKLTAYERHNPNDTALRELSKVEQTLFMVDWLESSKRRRRC